MPNFIFKFIVTIFILYIAGTVLPNVQVGSIPSLIFFLLFLGLLNGVVLPVIKIISFPINFLSLGLFNLFLNFLGLIFALNVINNAVIISSKGLDYFFTVILLSVVLAIPSYILDK